MITLGNICKIWNYLNDLPIYDDFWDGKLGGYNKQVFMMNKDETDLQLWYEHENKSWNRKQKKSINNLIVTQ